jgi:hypothetical protein
VGVAVHLVTKKGCSVLMSRKFSKTGGARMAAATMRPTISGRFSLSKLTAVFATSSAAPALVLEMLEDLSDSAPEGVACCFACG